MKLKQVSVFLENRTGRMADAARLLGDHGINIRALSIGDTPDYGILRLIVDDVVKAEKVFRDAGYTVALTDVIALEVPDEPGGLASVLTKLQRADIAIEYLYAFVEKNVDKAVVIFRFEDPEKVLRVIESLGLQAMAPEKLCHV